MTKEKINELIEENDNVLIYDKEEAEYLDKYDEYSSCYDCDDDSLHQEDICYFLASVKHWIETHRFNDFCIEIKKHIIGQEDIDVICACVWNYLENISSGKPANNNNVILAAPSGCGKTETYRVLKEYFKTQIPDLTIAQVDLSVITQEGIVGAGIDFITAPLIEEDLNGYGIIFLDEFDKKLLPSFAEGSNMNASVQSQILTLLEGRVVEAQHDGMPSGYHIDTNNTMFIGLGSYAAVRQNRESKSLGFAAEDKKVKHYDKITRKNMIDCGGSYELIGRFPFIVNYHKLGKRSIDKIIALIVNKIERSLGYDIVLSPQMRDELRKSANTEYGCRLFDSMIRKSVMPSYVKALKKHASKRIYYIYVESSNKSELKMRDHG